MPHRPPRTRGRLVVDALRVQAVDGAMPIVGLGDCGGSGARGVAVTGSTVRRCKRLAAPQVEFGL